MKTLRLLFWLRWRIALNTSSVRSRWAGAGIMLLFALLLSPLFVGGAAVSFAFARQTGPAALLVVFGCVQLVILWVSLLTGAMGRTFELDKLRRYPLRPLTVFAANSLASLTEPVMLATFPSVVAAAIGAGLHSGAFAGALGLLGGVLLMMITATLLQLLLALLDDLLRREWMRYVAALFFTLTLVGFQIIVGRGSGRLANEARLAGFTPERLMAEAMRMFEHLPTVAAPASAAGVHRAGWLEAPGVGLVACLALIAIPTWLGARVMAGAAMRATGSAPVRGESVGASSGSFGLGLPGLSRAQALLTGRELLYVLRTPAMLYQMAVIPLTAIGLSFMRNSGDSQFGSMMPIFILVTSVAGRNLMLWAYDGPGLRTLFLLPFTARDLVLSKNVAWASTALLEAAVVFTWMTLRQPATALPQLPLLLTGFLAVLLAGGVLGTWVSIVKPVKPPQMGMGRRSPGGLIGFGAVLVLLIAVGAIVLAVMGVRAIMPDAYDGAASLAVTSVFLIVSAVIWFIALERNADLLEAHREVMIDVLAKSSDA